VARVGLVLGGGGVVGQAYHSGVLAVLQHDYGFDARKADMVVGTSAGSITGSLLRLGVSAEDLAAWTVKAPLSGDDDVLRQMAEAKVPELAPFRPWTVLGRPMRLPGPHMLARALTRPLQFRPMAAGMALLAPGSHDIVEQLAALRELEGPGWPERDLWICAVRRRDGRRVVFGRPGSPAAPLHLAIGASCAVPGYFAPVRIGGHAYVDGGVHSPTNAAILRGHRLDIVIVIAPMSGPTGWRPGFFPAARRYSERLLQREVRALRDEGTRTVVFTPGADEQIVMGTDMMSRARLDEVVARSFIAGGAHAGTPEVADLLHAAAGT